MKSTIAILTSMFLALLLAVPNVAEAQHATTRVLTLDDARQILEAAEARAARDNWTVAIAVVDAGGHLVAFSKIDGTQVGSVYFAIDKAVSSVYYKRPTKAFEDAYQAGNTRVTSLPSAAVFEGGVPIEYNGEVIGAIGVSGVTAEQDGIIARAGLNALPR